MGPCRLPAWGLSVGEAKANFVAAPERKLHNSAMNIRRVELQRMRDDLFRFETEIKALMALLPDSGRLIGVAQRNAQELLRELKVRLHEESRREFTSAEQIMYGP